MARSDCPLGSSPRAAPASYTTTTTGDPRQRRAGIPDPIVDVARRAPERNGRDRRRAQHRDDRDPEHRARLHPEDQARGARGPLRRGRARAANSRRPRSRKPRSNQPTRAAKRVLEVLLHGLAHRESQGEGKADLWSLTTFARERITAAYKAPTTPPPHLPDSPRGVPANPTWEIRKMHTHPHARMIVRPVLGRRSMPHRTRPAPR